MIFSIVKINATFQISVRVRNILFLNIENLLLLISLLKSLLKSPLKRRVPLKLLLKLLLRLLVKLNKLVMLVISMLWLSMVIPVTKSTQTRM